MGCCGSTSVSTNIKESYHLPQDQIKSVYSPQQIQVASNDAAKMPAEAKKPVTTNASQFVNKTLLECVIDLLMQSEMLREAVCQEDITLGPLSSTKSSSDSISILKLFSEALTTSSQQPESKSKEIVKLMDKRQHSEPQPYQIFAALMSSYQVLRSEGSQPKGQIKDLIIKILELPLSSILETEASAIVFDGISVDLRKMGVAIQKSQDASVVSTIKTHISTLNEQNFWPLSKNFPQLTRILVIAKFSAIDDMVPEVANLVETINAKTYEALNGKDYDIDVAGPSVHSFNQLKLSVFTLLPSLMFGFASFDSSQILARVKRVKVQLYQEPDVESINCVEFTDNLSFEGKKVGFEEPLYSNVSVKNIIKKIAEKEDNPNLVTDFDPVLMFFNDNKVYYNTAKERLLEEHGAIGNQSSLRILLTKQKDLADPNTVKIAFLPRSNEVSVRTYNYLFALKRGDSLQVVLDKLSMITSTLSDDASNKTFEKLMKSLVFRNSIEPLLEAQLNAIHRKSQDCIKSQGWSTPISKILDVFKESSSGNFSSAKQPDLVITIHPGFFSKDLIPNSLGEQNPQRADIMRGKVPSVKPTLSEFFSQLMSKAIQDAAGQLNHHILSEFIPAYLYVDLTQFFHLIDISTELKLTFMEKTLEVAGIESGTKYRALGIIIEQKAPGSTTFVTYKTDSKMPSQLTYTNAQGNIVKTKVAKLDATTVRGIFLERQAKQF